jgi:hypothetical protein
MKIRTLALFTAVLFISMLPMAQKAWAHNLNSGYSYVHIGEREVDYELILPHPVLSAYDLDRNGTISDQELSAKRDELENYMKEHLQLYSGLSKLRFSMEDAVATIQEKTEDPVVRFHFRFFSDIPITELMIRYRIIIDDADPYHQNYIQMFKEGSLIGHQVVDKDTDTYRFAPGSQPRVHTSLIVYSVILGAQFMLKPGMLWLLVLSLCLTERRFRQATEKLMFFTLSHAAGAAVFHEKLMFVPEVSVYFLCSVFVFASVFGWLRDKAFGSILPLLLAVGVIHGAVMSPSGVGLGIVPGFRTIGVLLFHMGIGLAMAGSLYLLQTAIVPLIGRKLMKG